MDESEGEGLDRDKAAGHGVLGHQLRDHPYPREHEALGTACTN